MRTKKKISGASYLVGARKSLEGENYLLAGEKIFWGLLARPAQLVKIKRYKEWRPYLLRARNSLRQQMI